MKFYNFYISFSNSKKSFRNIKNIKTYFSKVVNYSTVFQTSNSQLNLKGYKKVSNISNEIDKLQKYYSSKNFKFSDNMIRIKYLKKFLNESE